jgi:hypothetical protein
MGPGDREKALAARVAELEALVKSRRDVQKGGNVVEQIWRYFAMFVPPPIIAAGIAVFVLFQAWDFYIGGQLEATDTQLKQAQASLDDAKATAQATVVNGAPVRVETLKAEVGKKQAEATRAKIEADALTTTIDGETAALQKVRADVARQQAAADQAKQNADAATARFGLQTLVEREAFVQFVKSELEKMSAKQSRAAQQVDANDSSLLAGYAERTYPIVIDAMCTDNALAKYVGCPDRYIGRQPTSAVATRSTTDAAPSAARPTPSFDCSKAQRPDEKTICATPELARLDGLVARAYDQLRKIPGSREAADDEATISLEDRQKCRADIACIKTLQRQELDAFRELGATVSY